MEEFKKIDERWKREAKNAEKSIKAALILVILWFGKLIKGIYNLIVVIPKSKSDKEYKMVELIGLFLIAIGLILVALARSILIRY